MRPGDRSGREHRRRRAVRPRPTHRPRPARPRQTGRPRPARPRQTGRPRPARPRQTGRPRPARPRRTAPPRRRPVPAARPRSAATRSRRCSRAAASGIRLAPPTRNSPARSVAATCGVGERACRVVSTVRSGEDRLRQPLQVLASQRCLGRRRAVRGRWCGRLRDNSSLPARTSSQNARDARRSAAVARGSTRRVPPCLVAGGGRWHRARRRRPRRRRGRRRRRRPRTARTSNPSAVRRTTVTSNVPAPKSYTKATDPVGVRRRGTVDEVASRPRPARRPASRLRSRPRAAAREHLPSARSPVGRAGEATWRRRAAGHPCASAATRLEHRRDEVRHRHLRLAEQHRAVVDAALRVGLETVRARSVPRARRPGRRQQSAGGRRTPPSGSSGDPSNSSGRIRPSGKASMATVFEVPKSIPSRNTSPATGVTLRRRFHVSGQPGPEPAGAYRPRSTVPEVFTPPGIRRAPTDARASAGRPGVAARPAPGEGSGTCGITLRATSPLELAGGGDRDVEVSEFFR